MKLCHLNESYCYLPLLRDCIERNWLSTTPHGFRDGNLLHQIPTEWLSYKKEGREGGREGRKKKRERERKRGKKKERAEERKFSSKFSVYLFIKIFQQL